MLPKVLPIRDITFVPFALSSRQEVPLFGARLQAGFPSPADDYLEGKIDLNQYLVRHSAATFLVRIDGDSMIGAGIFPGDIAIVDRSLVDPDIKAMHNKIVLAVIDGEFTIKRLHIKGKAVSLVAENGNYQPIAVGESSDFTIWGVVKHSIRHF